PPRSTLFPYTTLFRSDINKNQFMSNISPKPGSASTIIRSFKSICTKTINRQFPELHFKWQDRFHDRIIRDHDEYLIKENYILNKDRKSTRLNSSHVKI